MTQNTESLRNRGVNPQEATIPEDNEEDPGLDSPTRSKKSPTRKNKKKKKRGNQPTSQKKKRKSRNRVAYVAGVNNVAGTDTKELPAIPLPLTQYVTVLTRRAIRKREAESPATPTSQKSNKPQEELDDDNRSNTNNHEDEEYGDISLGMKLTVVGGKVIVQKLNSLIDGRASPAQIVGVIRRGDVLLSIDNRSLVNLPIDHMMDRLKPLSTPDASGTYQKVLHLRLSAGEGLEMLEKYEAAEARKANRGNDAGAASEVFTLFPMVDQLSGMPLFDSNLDSPSNLSKRQALPQHQEEKKQAEEDRSALNLTQTESADSKDSKRPMSSPVGIVDEEKSMDEIISSKVAQWWLTERNDFTSEYYAWNDAYSELLRPPEGSETMVAETDARPLTKTEMLERGRRALLGAENLSRAMENIDRGKDLRSFKSWNSSISLRSRAGTRRRYVLDAQSLPGKFDMKSATPKAATATASLASDDSERSDLEDVDGDALLLRLAAHDEIWRSQVIEALETARDNLANNVEEEELEGEEEISGKQNMNDAMSKEFGAFLFGEALAKVVTKKKKSKALPPEEITAVLFDLSTNLASSMPDEVAVGDGTTSSAALKSTLVPFIGKSGPEGGSSVILATRFVLDEALAVWLETFRPLPWESRRVLWPQSTLTDNAEGWSPSAFSDTDSLTLDSGMSPVTAYTGATNGTHNRAKDLRQQIEDQELDVETRAETCFLVTYYFTHKLLPKLAPGRTGNDSMAFSELVAYVRKYGAYLKLNTCLAYSAALMCKAVIQELLALAEHDLRHREVIKLFHKRHALILYEPTMLSAIVKCLPLIRDESNSERRQILVDVCVSAYPDLCPWQVRETLLEPQKSSGGKDKTKVSKSFKDLYYYYLSSLLHPQDGHEAARHDPNLVKEWCGLSLDAGSSANNFGANPRRKNFLSVASLNSSDHLAYYRDLPTLLELSMKSMEYALALDLATEIADNRALAKKEHVLALVLEFLRANARNALEMKDENVMFQTLKRTFRLFHQLPQYGEQAFTLAQELNDLWAHQERRCMDTNTTNSEVLNLINYMAEEIPPSDFLEAFHTWTTTHDWLQDSVAILQKVLKRGTRVALSAELSGSLLRLRRARQRMKSSAEDIRIVSTQSSQFSNQVSEPTVWHLMSEGLIAIDK